MSRGPDGRDLLDRFGNVAPLMRRRSRALADRYYVFARQMLIAGKLPEAQRMLEAAHEEMPSYRIRILATMLWFRRKAPWTWGAFLRPALLVALRARAAARSG
jgi:hypothetical protein